MARMDIHADWPFKNVLFSHVDPKGDLEGDKRKVIAMARAALDEAEKALDNPAVAQEGRPIARTAQANTASAKAPAPVEPEPKPKPVEPKPKPYGQLKRNIGR